MNLRLSPHQFEGRAVVEIQDHAGRICGTITASPEGLRLTSAWLAGVVLYEETRPRSADVFFFPRGESLREPQPLPEEPCATRPNSAA